MPTAQSSTAARRRLRRMSGIATCGVLLGACSSAPSATPASPTESSSVAPSATGQDSGGGATSTQQATAGARTVTVEVGTASGAKEFRYDKVTLTEPAGAKIRLKLVNHTDPKDEVGHNWVLVKAGQEAAVVASGQAAGDDKDWLDVNDPRIVAHTQLIEGGQSNTVTFTAAPGTYTYLCTFPKHYAAGEKGTLVIK